MRKAWKRMARVVMALTCAGLFWLPGADFSWVQKASGQGGLPGLYQAPGRP